MKEMMTHDEEQKSKSMLEKLNILYEKCINGVPYVSLNIEALAKEYLKGAVRGSAKAKKAAEKMIVNQVAKCAADGFITSIGGVISMVATLPANIATVLYMQMRMIACVAYMSGEDVRCDKAQTLVYTCLAGLSLAKGLERIGIQFSTKIATTLIHKIPKKILGKINKFVGFKLVTKFGSKGIINLGKCIPFVGALVGGGFDLIETKIIGKRALKMFFDGDFSDGEVIEFDASDFEILDE